MQQCTGSKVPLPRDQMSSLLEDSRGKKNNIHETSVGIRTRELKQPYRTSNPETKNSNESQYLVALVFLTFPV